METERERPSASNLVEKSLGSAVRAWRGMKPLLLSAALAYAAVTALLIYVRAPLGLSPKDTSSPVAMAFGITGVVAMAAILAPVAVAIHRMILLGEETPGMFSLRPNYTRTYFLWAALIVLLRRGIADGTDLAGGTWISLAIAFAGLALIRLALVFPAVAIGAPGSGFSERIETSWRQTAGNFWLVVRALLLLIIPIVVVGAVAFLLAAVIGLFLPAIRTAVAIIFMSAIVGPIATMLVAGVASWLYAWVREQPAG